MPFTLVGWTQSQDSAVLIATAALADQHVRVQGNDIIVPDFAPNLIGAYAVGPNVTRAQLITPTLRRVVNQEISPIDRSATPSSPPMAAMYPDSPIKLTISEALDANMAEDGAGATRVTILAWLSDGAIAAVAGQIFTVRVTGAVTLTANAWSNAALTFDQTLPAGKYGIVGARFISTGLQAFRFVFVGGTLRPGGLGNTAANAITLPGQRRGGWGVWGTFPHTTPPTVDFLSNSADTSEAGELDLIPVG